MPKFTLTKVENGVPVGEPLKPMTMGEVLSFLANLDEDTVYAAKETADEE